MIDTLAPVQGWLADVQASMADVPAELAAAVPDGDFASVLARVGSMLGTGPDGSAAAGAATGTGLAADGGTATAAVGTGTAGSGAATGQDVVADAAAYLGTPYVWGGASPSGFDCSGLVQYVYGQLGVSLPRTSEEQATVGTPVAGLAQAVPGDLVFFAGSDGSATAPGHVGIYVGDGRMIDAPQTGTVVQVQTVSAAGPPVAIRQVLPAAGPAGWTGAAAPTGPAGAGALGGAALPAVTGQGAAGLATGGQGPGGVPATLAPLFVAAAGRYGVPVTLLTAVARQESGFDPTAVSSAGAEGIMQLMPSTATGLGVDSMDPAQAIDGAAQLLSGYLAQFGSVPLALAAYNAGPGAVEQYGGVPPYPETQAYVAAIEQSIGGAG